MVLYAGRSDESIDFGERVWGDDVDGLELLGKQCRLGGSVRDIRVGSGFGGQVPCKAGDDHDKEHETLLGVSMYFNKQTRGSSLGVAMGQ